MNKLYLIFLFFVSLNVNSQTSLDKRDSLFFIRAPLYFNMFQHKTMFEGEIFDLKTDKVISMYLKSVLHPQIITFSALSNFHQYGYSLNFNSRSIYSSVYNGILRPAVRIYMPAYKKN